MRVRIVCYEDVDAWILGKFARMLDEELRAMSINSDIAKVPDRSADINHHIIYWDYNGEKNSIDTVMVTHIDTVQKSNQLRKQLTAAEMGICMSLETVEQLAALGLPREKLCYVNPAHDSVMRPRRTVMGITSKTHDDGRKKEHLLLQLAEKIEPDEFMFIIMGKGWQGIVDNMRTKGFTVEYYNEFDYDTYVKLVPSFDYYLYLSFDEGSMGFLDALAAGVQTIVTPQGFHLDAPGGITHPIRNLEDILNVFEQIAEKKRRLVRAVSSWTWADYARKHVEIWEYLLGNRSGTYSIKNKGHYTDGLSSVQSGNNLDKIPLSRKIIVKFKLYISSLYFFFYALKGLKRGVIHHLSHFREVREVYRRFFGDSYRS